MKLCTALKRDGNPCRAAAVLRDPDGHCVFHTSLDFAASKKAYPVTKDELLATLGREIRRLRKRKEPSPLQLQRASELRNLIELWISLNTPVVEPMPKPLTFAEKLKMLEGERPTKPAR